MNNQGLRAVAYPLSLDPHAQRANMFTRAIFVSPPAGSGPGISNRSTNPSFSHLEIELRPSIFGSLPGIFRASTKTILDLLEVYPDHVNWKESLGHSPLLKCFQVGSLSTQFREAEGHVQ